MFIKDWKKDVFTIPNMLSLFRLVLIPVYTSLYLNARELSDYFLAGCILIVSCLTDMIDGKIARHFNMISTLGKILDPVADKLTQFTLIICLSLRHPILRFVTVLFFVKELFQGIMGLVNLRQGKMLPGALMAGKVCTAVLFVSLIFLVLMPRLPETAVSWIALTDTAFLTVSFISYILTYFGSNRKVQDLNESN